MEVIALILLALSLVFAPKIKNKFNTFGVICFFVVVCLFLEVFCFNFETFRSATYAEMDGYTITGSENVRQEGDCFVLKSTSDFIEIKNLNEKVENIYVKTNTTMHTLRFFVSDSANDNRYHAGDRTISRYNDQTSYIKTNFTGHADHIRLYIPDIGNRIVTLSDIKLNCQRPILFSVLRPLGCFLLLVFIYFLILRRDLWQQEYDMKNPVQKNITTSVVCIILVLFTLVPFLNPGFISPSWAHHNQYNELAEAFMSGQLHLEKEPPDILKEMENPYDRVARKKVFAEARQTEPWDTAFYDGKYYVYFGVLPVFLFYLPAKIFGADFPNFLAVVIFSWILVIGIFLLYAELIKKYFKKVPFFLYLVLSVATSLSGGVFYIIKRPDFYSIPIIGALAFTVMGFYFWFSAIRENNTLVTWRVFTGSLFMASVIALRPNLIFFSCAAFIIFWNSVFKDRELLSLHSRISKRPFSSLKNTIAFCSPYIVIGVLVMVYNYLRFDSFFDFGAAYNLTTSDMTQRGFNVDRWGMGVFEYLFAPPNMSATFPYLTSSVPTTEYIGFTSSEGMFGGIFVTCPLLWSIFAIHKSKREKPFLFIVFLIVTSFITCLLDVQAGGVLPRYCSDFFLFLVMAAALVAFSLYKYHPTVINKFAAWTLLAIIVWDFLLLIAGGASTIQTMNKDLYMFLYSQLAVSL